MKFTKYILIICLLFVCIANNAQTSQIGKSVVKSSIKSGVKHVIKNSIKETQQKIVLKEIKDIAVKKGVKSYIAQNLEHNITHSIAKEISQKAFKESAENITKKSIKIKGEKLIHKQTKQFANGRIASSGNTFLKNKTTKYVVGKQTLDIAEHSINKGVADASSQILNSPDVKIFPKIKQEHIERYIPNTIDQKRFLDDILNDPQLAKSFQKNPDLIKNYSQCINSKLRTDKETLRYLNVHADEYADACLFSQTKYTRAQNLKFVDKDSKTLIINNKTSETLGIIEGDIIKIPSENHSLLNMKLMRNKKYHVDNSIFETDNNGRPIKVNVVIQPYFKGTKIYDRDKVIQRDFKKARINASRLDASKLDDDAGHIIAHNLGGVSDGINILPQNASLNRKEYKNIEYKISKDVNKGNKAEIEIEIRYNGASERPDEYIYKYFKNGKLDTQKVFKNIKKQKNN